ncbi:hypothetical protein L227DRAFT_604180 [Lentinus tigrinus ALCF2SS1-6]|uniref:Uncharacterized protein n=1 Tax=Lentinus tigrinus ALCF2SS1-6 TaxID=1328759 RepID=A0A5C2RRP3_9APHY|nr:hypothetical protein L227DRAFT_604180 [Lentinus tigrinus ALCF2SS1-6]
MPHPDDKYLFEYDLNENGKMQLDTDGASVKFTDRAKAAQAAKWKRLDEMFAPRKIISSRLLANRGGNPRRLAYGWVCTDEYFWHYATHHNLKVDAPDGSWLKEQAGTTEIRLGELTQDQRQNEELMHILNLMARLLVEADLFERSGIKLQSVVPFAGGDSAWVLALYTNYDMGDRCFEMEDVGGVAHVANVVQEAMTFGNYNPELLWWYDWEHLRVHLNTPL